MQGIRSVVLHKETEKVRYMHPTLRGVELFVWGTGLGQLGVESYFSNTPAKSDVERFALMPRQLTLGHVSYN